MHMNENIKDFYTINEFAEKLRVHPNTIRRAIKDARISAFRFGENKKTYRIPHTEIQRLLMCDLKEIVKKHMIENNEISL